MANKRVVIDPITRIEGHLRVEVEVDENNVIKNAFSSSTLWRGLEVIVKGRDPRDVGLIVQRICGVCTSSHYRAGIEAVEDALGVSIPLNARYVRSMIAQALFLHDHIVHFYLLHGLDWVDVLSALKANPKKAEQEAYKYTQNPYAAGEADLRSAQEKVQKMVDGGQLGIFANGYWGNKTYKLTPEQNLIALSHYLKCIEVQRDCAKLMAILGGKQPHPQSFVVGGVTCVRDLLDPSRLAEWKTRFEGVKEFVERAYYPDVLMAAKMFGNEASVTQTVMVPNFISGDGIALNATENLFNSGYILNKDLSKAFEIDESLIMEECTHSWYKEDKPLHPYEGQTEPNYTGFIEKQTIDGEGKSVQTPSINEQGKYSWIKSPRYDAKPFEVGPLASMLVGYAQGNKRIKKVVDEFLSQSSLPVSALFTTLGRTAGRMLQTKLIVEYGLETFNSLVENLKKDESTCTPISIDPNKEYKGRYIGEVPRGMLSHWIRIKEGVVENYQAVVPSTWNAGPVDAKGQKGPYEANLIGMKLQDMTKPLEIIRNIHSYDPCIACAVHIMDTKGNKLGEYKIDPKYLV
ncbi:nickel-dependent hydrogenase large subunit [Helicobacter cholecystus]|uniref:Nickel-dependent hydrogenase large subunit n=1 Tax=Helicobacter cholecystus TaxID=45498 RepID=A0A3D8IW99_9HELI|nr:nickel-dependent hydrogenase large subunit [Helicobacter cholecystus]RDU69557.1 nickel-dependent hydrogenase large subunit [Helicobacter cholecystus]VEJ24113.1 Ni/Fe hydrogenase alpha subunit [Helicobacter cholecystus]